MRDFSETRKIAWQTSADLQISNKFLSKKICSTMKN